MSGNDSNTKVLLHFDGANNSTTFTDTNAGGSAHSWSATGASKISTSASVFGGASLAPSTTDGNLNTNYVSAASSTDWNFGSGNFTIEGRFQINNGTTDKNTNGIALAWWDGGSGSRGFRFVYLNGQFLFSWTTDGSTYKTAAFTQAISASTFYHVALVRSGSTLYLFVAGSSVTNTGTSISTDTIFSANMPLTIGGAYSVASAGYASVNGYVDEFRVSKTARWTANFTPPSAAYGVDYTLSALAGAITLAGSAATLLSGRGYQLALSAGSYAITGTAATMRKVMHLTASAGSYAVTGVAATLKKSMHMALGSGSYALIGAASVMKKTMHLTASAGSYVMTLPMSIISYFPAGPSAIRRLKFSLQKLRTTDPTLEQ